MSRRAAARGVTRRRPSMLLGVLLLVGCGRDALTGDMIIERLVEDLGPRFTSQAAPAGGTTPPSRRAVLQPGDRERGGGPREAVVPPLGVPLGLRVDVPAEAVLRFSVGVEGDQQRDVGRSGVAFTISVGGRTVYREDVNPASSRRDRRWFDGDVDLRPWAGTTVDLVLEVRPEDGRRPLAGTPGWSHLRIVRQDRRGRQPAGAGPSVLLVLVDTLRADYVGAYGAEPSPTPALDAVAARGLVFDPMVAQASWTMPAVGSIFTGLYPRSHGAVGRGATPVDGGGTMLPDSLTTLAELAQDAGITTLGVSASPVVNAATNMAQGFEEFIELPFDKTRRDYAPASAVNREFLGWLDRAGGLRFLAYLHYMEPHGPYDPPPRFRPQTPPGIRGDVAAGSVHDLARNLDRGTARLPTPVEVEHLRNLYAGDIRAWDADFGELLRALADRGVLDRTVVVVVADHGEEFLEHGKLTHGLHLYDETVRVPLLMAGPGIVAGRRQDQAEQIDLLPTLAALLGVAPPPGLPGRDLLATRDGGDAISEIVSGFGDDGTGAGTVALRTARWKLIRAPGGTAELYDLVADPGERHDLAADSPETATLGATLDAWARAAPRAPHGGADDPSLRERLRQLGYVE